MEARLVRDELARCQRAEGVNTNETCQALAERYLAMLRDNRVRVSLSSPLPPLPRGWDGM
jgi:NADH dehydrogenase (ubiquinone) 1 beta subcomplex subunit 10